MADLELLNKAVPGLKRYLAAHAAMSAKHDAMKAAGQKPPDIDGDLEAAIDHLWFVYGINHWNYSFAEMEAAVERSETK